MQAGEAQQPTTVNIEPPDESAPIPYASLIAINTSDRDIVLSFIQAVPTIPMAGSDQMGQAGDVRGRIISRVVLPRQTGVELLKLLAPQLGYKVEEA